MYPNQWEHAYDQNTEHLVFKSSVSTVGYLLKSTSHWTIVKILSIFELRVHNCCFSSKNAYYEPDFLTYLPISQHFHFF